eukprot:TRINITY_DN32799_c0_g1_i1.p1 TRINITY_DN32799_c0_g1~~TRINITY_DN32799_c0_g1_i1.p1  ORF type:complete len:209 (+),score=84.83 TRINITY_DN32799_c0_g1_i1:80-628(+)
MAVADLMRRLIASADAPMPANDRSLMMDWMMRQVERYEAAFNPTVKLPEIRGEQQLVETLAKHPDQLVVVKYWKQQCIPCLAYGDMYKRAEGWFKSETVRQGKQGIVFYSVNIKDRENLEMSDRQLVEGTPTIQKFWNGRQVGGEVQCMELNNFCRNTWDTWQSCLRGRCPADNGPEKDPKH